MRWIISTENFKDFLMGLSFSLFYYILFKLKKIEIQLNLRNTDEDMIFKQLIKLIRLARTIYLFFLLVMFGKTFILFILIQTDRETLHDKLRVVSIIACVFSGIIFLINLYFIKYFWSMVKQYTVMIQTVNKPMCMFVKFTLVLLTIVVLLSTINWNLVDSFRKLNDAYFRIECPSYVQQIFIGLEWVQSSLPFFLGSFLNLVINYLASQAVDEDDYDESEDSSNAFTVHQEVPKGSIYSSSAPPQNNNAGVHRTNSINSIPHEDEADSFL